MTKGDWVGFICVVGALVVSFRLTYGPISAEWMMWWWGFAGGFFGNVVVSIWSNREQLNVQRDQIETEAVLEAHRLMKVIYEFRRKSWCSLICSFVGRQLDNGLTPANVRNSPVFRKDRLAAIERIRSDADAQLERVRALNLRMRAMPRQMFGFEKLGISRGGLTENLERVAAGVCKSIRGTMSRIGRIESFAAP